VLRHSDLAGRSCAGGVLLVVDIGLPRNVDPEISETLAEVVTLDDLAKQTLVPEAEIAWREAAVENGMTAWREWRAARAVDGIIGSLYRDVDQMVAATTVECARAKHDPGIVERTVRAQVRSLLDGHVRSLRSLAWDLARCGPES